MNESQAEALAKFKFRLRGEKRTHVDNDDSQPEGPNAKVSKLPGDNQVIVEARGMPDDGVDVRLFNTSTGNSTVKIAVPREKVSSLERAGVISVQYVNKTPDGKKLSVGQTMTDQVVASSAIPTATVEGYLDGFPLQNLNSSNESVEEPTPAKEKPKKRKICAVPTCTDPQDKHYFVFPYKDRAMNHMWVQKVKRADKEFNPASARICENHFSSKMIQRDLKAELLGLQVKKKLVKGAFPDVNLPGQKGPIPAESLPETPQNVPLPGKSQVTVTSPTMNETANCTVKGCRNPNRVRYYSFPKNEEIRKLWIKKCGRKETFNTKKRSVCAIHFSESDFKIDLKAQLLEGIERKILKEDAVPSLHLNGKVEDQRVDHDESVSINHDESASVDVAELLNASDEVEVPPVEISAREKRSLIKSRKRTVTETLKQESISAQKHLEDRVQKLEEENERLVKQDEESQQKISELEAKVKALQMDRKKDKLENMNLKKKVKRLKSVKPKEVNKEMKKTLERKMSPANVKMLMNPKKHYPHYSDQDKIEALVLSTISKKCYKHVRGFNQLQLPHISTLQKWLSEFECSPGFQEDAIRILKTMKEKTKLKNYNICELVFDEVDIKKNLMEIDMKAQKVYGPCNKVQMVMIRGLYHNWKQPIYYSFNESMKKKLLFKIIERMERED